MPAPLSMTSPTSAPSQSDSSGREDATIYTPPATPNDNNIAGGNNIGGNSIAQDIALLSIEADEDPSNRSRTPSLSFTPSPSIGLGGTSGFAGPMPRSTPTPSNALAGLDNQFDSLALSVESPSAAPLALRSLSPNANRFGKAGPRPRRRRSSTRGSQIQHEISDEEPPEDQFHDAAFQVAFSNAKRLMASMAEALSSSSICSEDGSTLQRLHQEATRLAGFQYLNTRIVGLVGDSGVGKSSLINSLLDIKNFARTSNSGAACTCVATEYHYFDGTDFIVEAECFTFDQIKAQIIELLRSYRHFHLNSREMETGEQGDSEERASLAQDTFRAMFSDRMQGDGRFLLDNSEESALSQLLQWASETGYLAREDGLASRRMHFPDSKQCSDYLMQLTSDHRSSQELPSWPFIQKIKVSLNTHILSKGLILVDLPGLRDLNSARRNITERYILNCDEIFVVCYIGRASTDAGVETVVDLAQRAGLSNLGIVCTKSDDIRADEAQRDWGGQRAATIQGMIDSIATCQQDFSDLVSESADYAAEDDLLPEEQEYLRQLTLRTTTARERLGQHELELKRFLIENRNQSVQEALHQLYDSKIAGSNLRVFCVSNILYSEYRDRPKNVALPYLRLSGILDIRKHSISIVSQSQFRAAMQLIKDDIPAFIGSVNLWVQSGAENSGVERKRAIRNLLDKLENGLRRKLDLPSLAQSVVRPMETKFNQLVYGRRRTAQWSQYARSASSIWSRWSPRMAPLSLLSNCGQTLTYPRATYSTFCRNYGNHYTTSVGAHNWNEEAIEQMVSDVVDHWETLIIDLETIQSSISQLFETSLDEAINLLVGWVDAAPSPVEALRGNLMHRQRLLLSEIEYLYYGFGRELSTLRTDAFSGIRTSIIGQLMESSYIACTFERGRGSDARRKAIISAKFSDPAIFTSHFLQLKIRFSALTGNLEATLQKVIASHLTALKLDLDLLRDENVVLESERDPEFHSRMETTVANAMESLQEIQRRAGI